MIEARYDYAGPFGLVTTPIGLVIEGLRARQIGSRTQSQHIWHGESAQGSKPC